MSEATQKVIHDLISSGYVDEKYRGSCALSTCIERFNQAFEQENERLKDQIKELHNACSQKQEIIDSNKSLVKDLIKAKQENEEYKATTQLNQDVIKQAGDDLKALVKELEEVVQLSGIREQLYEAAKELIGETAEKLEKAELKNKRLTTALKEIDDGPGEYEDRINQTNDYHVGLHCGLEDRDIFDRYGACDYGQEEGVEAVLEWCQGITLEALKEVSDVLIL